MALDVISQCPRTQILVQAGLGSAGLAAVERGDVIALMVFDDILVEARSGLRRHFW